MISNYFNTTYTVQRMSWYNEEYSELGDEDSFLGSNPFPLTDELVEALSLVITKSFSVYCPVNTDVKEGDVLSSSGTNYIVKALINNNYYGQNKHIRLILQRQENYI